MAKAMPVFQPVRRSRLYEDIVRQIQDLIADKDLKPGTKLPGERELAEALSVSRQALREALRVLDYIGVVEVRAGEGTFVARTPPVPLDASMYGLLSERTFLLELLEARGIVEQSVVHLAVQRATEDDLETLEAALSAREQEVAAGKRDVVGDLNFHEMLAELTANPVLLSVMRHLNELWLQSRERTGRKRTSPQKALQFHRKILTAIRRRQSALAGRILRQHLDDMRRDVRGG